MARKQKDSKALAKSKRAQPPADLGIQTGDFVIDDDGRVYRVGKIDKKKGVELLHKYDSGKWGHYTFVEKWPGKNHRSSEYLKLDRPIKELEKLTLDEVKDLSHYEQPEPEESDSREIALTSNKQTLVNLKAGFEMKANKLEIMHRIMERKRQELHSILSGYLEQINKVKKVLDIIELYLGIHEEIVILREGEKAPQTEPISIRQQVLYMDEEVGDPKDQGLDFKKIGDFDDWILTKNHLDQLLPEKKGIVVLRVRRRDKEYDSSGTLGAAFVNSKMNKENHKTYFLIRNGKNVYRIWANITIAPRLFPTRDEIKELDSKKDGYSYDGEKASDALMDYKRNILALQGLIDRTAIFQPLPHPIQLFKPDTHGKALRLIYDDELKITDGHLYWKEWRAKLNSKIERGSRIYFCGFGMLGYRRFDKEGLGRLPYEYRYAEWPDKGIYTVDHTAARMKKSLVAEKTVTIQEEKEAKLYCYYNPGDTIYPRLGYYRRTEDEEPHPRKRRIRFLVYPSDECVLNYDQLSLDDVEYYLNSRVDRENYLDMIPVLWGIRRQRLKELEWERGFVENLKLRFKVKEELIWKAIDWWKLKCIWKRPIMKDDSKALRMISWKVKKLAGIKTSREDICLTKGQRSGSKPTSKSSTRTSSKLEERC